MSYYNDDVVREILLWLPAKSLIRFKSVCKWWFSLISSSQFSHLHALRHRRSPPETSFLLRLSETSQYFYLHGSKLVQYHFPLTLLNPTVRSYSNGLLLLVENGNENALEHCYIYNPTTKEFKKIILSVNERFTCVMGLNLAFDPSKSPHYKIICVKSVKRRLTSRFFRDKWLSTQIEMYDSGTNIWKNFGESFLAPLDVDFNGGIYWNNGIHWNGLFIDFGMSDIGRHPDVVFPFPQEHWRDYFQEDYYYIESNGCFHYITHFPEEKWIGVFELQRDYSQWLLKYETSYNLDLYPRPVSVLSFIKEEEEDNMSLLIHQPGWVMTYEIAENSLKEVINFEEESFYRESCVQFFPRFTYQFFESLVPID